MVLLHCTSVLYYLHYTITLYYCTVLLHYTTALCHSAVQLHCTTVLCYRTYNCTILLHCTIALYHCIYYYYCVYAEHQDDLLLPYVRAAFFWVHFCSVFLFRPCNLRYSSDSKKLLNCILQFNLSTRVEPCFLLAMTDRPDK